MGYQAYDAIDLDAFMILVVPFIVVYIYTSEYSKHTLKNFITHRVDRSAVFLGKIVAFLIVLLALNAFIAIAATGVYTALNGFGSTHIIASVINIFFYVIKLSLYYFSASSVAIILSALGVGEALTVIIFFSGSIVESIIASVLSSSEISFISQFSKLFPTNYLRSFLSVNGSDVYYAWISISISIIICITIGLLITNRRDVV